jgi:hypothetical protein
MVICFPTKKPSSCISTPKEGWKYKGTVMPWCHPMFGNMCILKHKNARNALTERVFPSCMFLTCHPHFTESFLQKRAPVLDTIIALFTY